MSFWTSIRDTVEKVGTLGLYDPERRRQERDQRKMINNQINAYKEQTALTRQQLNETRAETAVEKRSIQEKQIRSLRRNYRAQGAGMLGQGQAAEQDMNNKLGG